MKLNFEELAQLALQEAKKLGASQALAEVSESNGLSISVRKSDVETVEQTSDCSLGVTLFKGKSRASASTSSLTPEAVCDTVKAAWDIAQYTAEDPFAGLPDEEDLATEFPDLKLHKAWRISSQEAIDLALQVEKAALSYDKAITNSEGAQVNTSTGRFVLANSLGFMAGYPYSNHSMSVAVIAGKGAQMQRDYWYSSHRYPEKLAKPEAIGEYAAQRALSRLGAKRIPTGKYPVLFDAPLAIGLLGAFAQAISGGALYRRSSFLCDSLGKRVMASHLNITDDPFIKGAMGSSAFDEEGVRTQKRELLTDGILNGYLLSTYTARKLGMRTTGNAGGSHNMNLSSSLTRQEDDFVEMLRKMGTGLLVTELMGQGINYVTGDYSRGAFGYWVENGVIQHAVQEITIAGNLRDMFQQIVAVGSDMYTRGSKTSGSILIEQMSVAGV
ncbi:metalloprotease PmbA [Pelistega europaea]|uniref:Metalloprotease PmbA n=1 Tax=Pelistega europaea TaxID=106147 RepID=A0A7Y4P5W4_9BURK|nr:metalloprotease PmbA [Pelistega europaea]NOL49289.1 metalloprotease PmbA [Pelistega europaea]